VSGDRKGKLQLYVRAEDSKQPGRKAQVQAGPGRGQGALAENFTEAARRRTASTVLPKRFPRNWSGEKSRIARILVKYAP